MNICFDFLSTGGHWQLSKGKFHLKKNMPHILHNVYLYHLSETTFLFCRYVAIVPQNFVVNCQESVSTQHLKLWGGWLQRYITWAHSQAFATSTCISTVYVSYSSLPIFLHFLYTDKGKKAHLKAVWCLLLWHSGLGADTHKIPFEDVTDVLDLCKNVAAVSIW